MYCLCRDLVLPCRREEELRRYHKERQQEVPLSMSPEFRYSDAFIQRGSGGGGGGGSRVLSGGGSSDALERGSRGLEGSRSGGGLSGGSSSGGSSGDASIQ